MSKIGHGYGSEYHLLRYLGYQRGELNRKVDEATGGRLINWLDFPFSDSPKSFYHAEWQGVSFLRDDEQGADVREAWQSFWPQTGTAPSWDAVGVMDTKGATAWLLVEAKAHLGELKGDCVAGPKAKPMIEHALTSTKEALGIAADCDWASPYYQFCNRLAILHFLSEHGIAAHLLFVYFTGDDFARNPAIVCPQSAGEWEPALAAMHECVGWPGNGALATRVHELFLPMHSLQG
jgi:hypothetical protein